jgi:hypothetical protein
MTNLYSNTLAANAPTADLTVTFGDLIGVCASRPVVVYDVNEASGGRSMALLGRCPGGESRHYLSATGKIVVIAEGEASRVVVNQ